METNNTERRVLINQPVELRKSEEGKEYIEGYGIVFNEWSENLGGFIERIDPGAVEGLSWADVVATRNHNMDLLLGRVPKTMDITVDGTGTRYKIDPPNTTAGNDTLESIRRGDINGSSFIFTVKEDDWVRPERDGEPYQRTIKKFGRVIEMGPVVGPAYPQTDATVAKRNLGMIRDEEERKQNEKIEQLQRDTELVKIQQEQLSKRLQLISTNIKTT